MYYVGIETKTSSDDLIYSQVALIWSVLVVVEDIRKPDIKMLGVWISFIRLWYVLQTGIPWSLDSDNMETWTILLGT